MQEELVSIILPVYNVEKYLERCLESIVNQTYRNLEIILVDDGSQDSSPQICDDWAKRDARIKVIHKENGGLGFARNTGIENFTGQYVLFVDSDDYIALETVERAYKLQKQYQAEMVFFGFCSVRKTGQITMSMVPNTPKAYFEGTEVQTVFLPNLISPDVKRGIDWNLNMSAWIALYQGELIKKSGWKFVSEREIISEDQYSLLDLFKDVSKVAICPEAFYYYCENDSSLSRTYRKERFEKVKICYLESIKLAEKVKYCDEVMERLSGPFLSNVIATMKQVVTIEKNFKDKLLELRYIVDDDVLQNAIRGRNNSKEKRNRKILFFCIRHKLYLTCYALCRLKRRNK